MSRIIIVALTALILSGCNFSTDTETECGLKEDGITPDSMNFEVCDQDKSLSIKTAIYPQLTEKSAVLQNNRAKEITTRIASDPQLAAFYESTAKKTAIAREPMFTTLCVLFAVLLIISAVIHLMDGIIQEKEQQNHNQRRYQLLRSAKYLGVFIAFGLLRFEGLDNLSLGSYIASEAAFTGDKIGNAIARQIMQDETTGDAILDDKTQNTSTQNLAKDMVVKTARMVASDDQTSKSILFYQAHDLNKPFFKQISLSTDGLFHKETAKTKIYREAFNSSNVLYTLGTYSYDKESFGSYTDLANKANWQNYVTDDAGAFQAKLEGFSASVTAALGVDPTYTNESVKTMIAQLAMINRGHILNKTAQETFKNLKPAYYQLLELACNDSIDAGKAAEKYIKFYNSETKIDGFPVCIQESGSALKPLGRTSDANYNFEAEAISTRDKNIEAATAIYSAETARINTILVNMNKSLVEVMKSAKGLTRTKQAAQGGVGVYAYSFLDIKLNNEFDSKILTQFNSSYRMEISDTDKQMVAEGFLTKDAAKYAVVNYIDIKKYLDYAEFKFTAGKQFKTKDYQDFTPEFIEESYKTSSASGSLWSKIEYNTRSPLDTYFTALGLGKECMEKFSVCPKPATSVLKALKTLGDSVGANSSALYVGSLSVGIASSAITKIADIKGAGKGGVGTKNKKIKALNITNSIMSAIAPVAAVGIVASAIPSYLVPLMITLPPFLGWTYHTLFVMMSFVLLPFLLLRFAMPNDADNLVSIRDKIIKYVISLVFFTPILVITTVVTVELVEVSIRVFSLLQYHFLPTDDWIGVIVSYLIITYSLLAVIVMDVKLGYTIIKEVQYFLGNEHIMADKPTAIVDVVQQFFFRFIPGMHFITKAFQAFRNRYQKK